MARIRLLPPTSPTRSPPAKSSSGRRRSSRSWSRTRSTPGPAASRSTTELGGKSLVRVEDDGDGMEADDARLAIERHATSKIAQRGGPRRDPHARLPRRGAAEHRVGLPLRAPHAPPGRALRNRDSRGRRSRSVGRARSPRQRGRAIEVADLFYNLPARRKFLKSDAAESAQISRVMTQFALGYPEVGFTLTSGARRVLAVRAGDERARSALSGLRRSAGSDRGVQGGGGHPHRRLRRGARRAGAGPRSAARLREPAYRPRSDDGARHHRRLQQRDDQGTESRRCTCSWRCRRTASTSTSIPTKAEVRFLEPSLVHEVLRRALADTLGKPAVPELQLQAAGGARIGAPEPTLRPIPGVFGEVPTSGRNQPVRTGWSVGRWADPPPLGLPGSSSVHPGSDCRPSPAENGSAPASASGRRPSMASIRWCRSVSSGIPTSSRSTPRACSSSISTWRTSACCSSRSSSG